MGPLLFVINDLPNGLENVFKMYADDSKVIVEIGEDMVRIIIYRRTIKKSGVISGRCV